MDKVNLRAAFEWRCPKCRTSNFNRAVDVELTDDDKKDLLESCGIDSDEVGAMIQAPAIVKCGKCGERFLTEDDEEQTPYLEDGE